MDIADAIEQIPDVFSPFMTLLEHILVVDQAQRFSIDEVSAELINVQDKLPVSTEQEWPIQYIPRGVSPVKRQLFLHNGHPVLNEKEYEK